MENNLGFEDTIQVIDWFWMGYLVALFVDKNNIWPSKESQNNFINAPPNSSRDPKVGPGMNNRRRRELGHIP
jgi:hypothetical protein